MTDQRKKETYLTVLLCWTDRLPSSLASILEGRRGSRPRTVAAAAGADAAVGAAGSEKVLLPFPGCPFALLLRVQAEARPVLRARAGRGRQARRMRPVSKPPTRPQLGSRAHDADAESQPRTCKRTRVGEHVRRGSDNDEGADGRGCGTDSCRIRECWFSRSYSAWRITCDS